MPFMHQLVERFQSLKKFIFGLSKDNLVYYLGPFNLFKMDSANTKKIVYNNGTKVAIRGLFVVTTKTSLL